MLFFAPGMGFTVPVVLGVPAIEGGLATRKMWDGICRYIENATGIETTFIVYADHSSLLKALFDHFVDIAFLDALWFYINEDRLSVLAAAKTGCRSGFVVSIIVPRGSRRYSVEDLHGATLALTKPYESSAGYFIPLALLVEAGMTSKDLDSILFVETFDSILKAVAYGGIQAGGVPLYFLEDEKVSQLADSVRIIVRSDPVAAPLLAIRKAMHDDRYGTVRDVIGDPSRGPGHPCVSSCYPFILPIMIPLMKNLWKKG